MDNLAIETIKNLVKEAGTQAKVAENLGITPSYLSDILKGKREVSESVADKLGLLRRTIYVHVSPDGKIYGDQIGEGLRRHDELVARAQSQKA